MDKQTTEKDQEQKGFFAKAKGVWNDLLPIYKNAIKSDPKSFVKTLASSVAVSCVFGGVLPWVSGVALNAASEAVKIGAVNAIAWGSAAGRWVLQGLQDSVSGYGRVYERSFGAKAHQALSLQRVRDAAKIPEEARGQKDETELVDYAVRNAQQEVNLLSDTKDIAFQAPALCLALGQIFFRSPAIGAAVAAFIAANGYLTYRLAQKNASVNAAYIKSQTNYRRQMKDHVYHQQRIKNLGIQDQEVERISEVGGTAFGALFLKLKRQFSTGNLQRVMKLLTFTGIGVSALVYATKTGDLGACALLTSAAAVAANSGDRLTSVIGRMRENLDQWRTTRKELSYDHKYDLTYGDKTIEHVKGGLEIRGVSYTFPGNQGKTLSDINLKIGNGITVIMGPSGHGKTTLLKMLTHMREPQEGQILLDGVPVTELKEGFLEKQIAILSQNPDFFQYRSIKENLDAAQSEPDDVFRRRVLKSVGLYSELGPDGFERPMTQLSGGQQQREQLAETQLQRKPIIILDEPTAKLDQENRKAFWRALDDLSEKHTIIVVTHDVREIQAADHVICIQKGQVIQDGTPEELLQQKGYFQDIVKQAHKPLRRSEEAKLNEVKNFFSSTTSHSKRKLKKQYKKALGNKKLARKLIDAESMDDLDPEILARYKQKTL